MTTVITITIIDSNTHLEVKGQPASQSALCLTLLPSSPQNAFEAILKDYPAVLQTSPQQPVKLTTFRPQDLPSIQRLGDCPLLNWR